MRANRGIRLAWILIIAAFIATSLWVLAPIAAQVWKAYHEQASDG
jgi:hypothetical protein